MAGPDIDDAAAAIARAHGRAFPKTALVLGSGLGRFGEAMAIETTIPYGEIPGFPVATVVGHSGRLLIGRVGKLPLVAMQGRMHLYEGHEPARLALPVRALRLLGVETLILTNAAGSLREENGPGTLMVISDHLNMTGRNPLIGANDARFGERFFDMSQAWDPDLRARLHAAARAQGIALAEGVYAQMSGPSFETPAEVRMLGLLGADAVGMSTVPECLVARHAGMRVAGLSVITNLAAGIARHALSHEETIREADKAYDRMKRLLSRFFGDLAG